MKKIGNFFWEGLSTETKPCCKLDAGDGHIFKEMDTGLMYERQAGQWTAIGSGYTCGTVSKSGKVTTNSSGINDVVFSAGFVDADYSIILTTQDIAGTQPSLAHFTNVTASGFRIQTRYSRTGNTYPNVVVSWLATRYYNPFPN